MKMLNNSFPIFNLLTKRVRKKFRKGKVTNIFIRIGQ